MDQGETSKETDVGARMRPAQKRCADCASRERCPVGNLPAVERESFAAVVEERAFRKGQVLQEQGQLATRLRILKTGTVLLLRCDREGRQCVVGLAGRGQTLGKFALMSQPDALTCIGASGGRFCEIDFAAARAQGLLHSRFLSGLALAHVREFGRLADWAHVMRVGGARGQLLAALLLLADEQGSGCVRLPSQTVLAELLGTTRETVARSLRTLETARQLVRRDRWHCELLPQGPI